MKVTNRKGEDMVGFKVTTVSLRSVLTTS